MLFDELKDNLILIYDNYQVYNLMMIIHKVGSDYTNLDSFTYYYEDDRLVVSYDLKIRRALWNSSDFNFKKLEPIKNNSQYREIISLIFKSNELIKKKVEWKLTIMKR